MWSKLVRMPKLSYEERRKLDGGMSHEETNLLAMKYNFPLTYVKQTNAKDQETGDWKIA